MLISVTIQTRVYEKYCYEDSEYTIYEYVFDRIERYYKVSEKEFDFKTLRLKDIISLYLNVIDKEYMKTEIEGNDLSVVEEKEKQLTQHQQQLGMLLQLYKLFSKESAKSTYSLNQRDLHAKNYLRNKPIRKIR